MESVGDYYLCNRGMNKEEVKKELAKVTDHKFQNPCYCGCDGSEMLCRHYDEDYNECLKPKSQHE